MTKAQIFTLTCTWVFIMGAIIFVSRIIYKMGVQRGRQLQALEDRRDIEDAIIKKAKAEQLAEAWARRARALLRVVAQ